MWLGVPIKKKKKKNSPPITIPINREEYTSFVISARAMATTGGTSDQNVPIIFIIEFSLLSGVLSMEFTELHEYCVESVTKTSDCMLEC